MMAEVRSFVGTLAPGDLLRIAIRERRLITFTWHGLPRRAEPHDYGFVDGERTLLFYQVGGQHDSRPAIGWRRAKLTEMRDLLLLDIRFQRQHDIDSGVHVPWQRLLASVSHDVSDATDDE